VWRNEKPGPGRFRQFTQFDADTVGTDNIAADAEICMLAADTLEALGVKRGDYVIKVNNRKVLDGVMASIGLDGEANAGRRLTVLRALDKKDRLSWNGVVQLLSEGRRDESGDFTRGARLDEAQIARVLSFVAAGIPIGRLAMDEPNFEDIKKYIRFSGDPGDPNDGDMWGEIRNERTLESLAANFSDNGLARQGIDELRALNQLVKAAGYGDGQITVSPSVVRGLEYYTGPVFEAELTFQVKNEDGQTVRFGSVGGGGRYDGLVERFLGTKVAATGFSIGVSRLAAALAALNRDKPAVSDGPVVVLVMEKDRIADYQRMVQALRSAGIRAEMYLGTSGMKAQMKYADKRGAPCVVIQGGDERAKGEVQIKDLIEGTKAAATIKDSKEWREGRPAQVSVKQDDLVAAVRDVLARHRG
jgi:histidyl-tRNA synthetase